MQLVGVAGVLVRQGSTGNFRGSARVSRHFGPKTFRHYQTGAEVSWVRSVLGPKCLDTVAGVLVRQGSTGNFRGSASNNEELAGVKFCKVSKYLHHLTALI